MTLYYSIGDLRPYINWMYFRHAWGLPMHPLACPCCAPDWQNLYKDALKVLKQWDVEARRTTFRVELLESSSNDEDIILRKGDRDIVLPFLRQQHSPYLCIADFVRPADCGTDTVGVFASTVDPEMENQEGLDQYQKMLRQTLADRLAEATAERGHEEVRKHIWGYSPDENLTPEDLFHEKYQGKRPAVGYPSMPDQSINFILSEILDFPSMGIVLTESGAMRPHASTSGIMLSHPRARHFSVGKVGEDQLQDYARRRGIPVEQIRRFFS